MSLVDIMIDQLAVARSIVEDGQVVVPAWRITTPEGAFLVLTHFETNRPEQRERALILISRFMAWKMATSFVLTAETWLGAETRIGEEALLVVGVSRHERFALLQRLSRGANTSFGMAEWLTPAQVDETYVAILPTGRSEITGSWRRSD